MKIEKLADVRDGLFIEHIPITGGRQCSYLILQDGTKEYTLATSLFLESFCEQTSVCLQAAGVDLSQSEQTKIYQAAATAEKRVRGCV